MTERPTPEEVVRDTLDEAHQIVTFNASLDRIFERVMVAAIRHEREAADARVAAALTEAARIARFFNRDASFDDSSVGAGEHNANQNNIASAIEAYARGQGFPGAPKTLEDCLAEARAEERKRNEAFVKTALQLDACASEFDGNLSYCQEYLDAFWDACAAIRAAGEGTT
jgi:hypothetical protein